jgi:hypothetical protein
VSVYGEWHWSCQWCDDTSEEPWGDPEAAREEFEEHMQTYHPADEEQEQS